jgi:hypothetical protein
MCQLPTGLQPHALGTTSNDDSLRPRILARQSLLDLSWAIYDTTYPARDGELTGEAVAHLQSSDLIDA